MFQTRFTIVLMMALSFLPGKPAPRVQGTVILAST